MILVVLYNNCSSLENTSISKISIPRVLTNMVKSKGSYYKQLIHQKDRKFFFLV